MRFCLGKVAPNQDFHPERDGWRKFREPSMAVFWVCALPVAAATFVGLSIAIASVGDDTARIVINTREISGWEIALFFLSLAGLFVGVLIAHELIHLAAHPRCGLSRDSVFGVWPRAGVCYAFYDNEVSRNRFLFIIALPFLALSITPVVLFWATGKVILWLAFVALANGLGACFDILIIGMVIAQVPSATIIRNKGWETYWRPSEESNKRMESNG